MKKELELGTLMNGRRFLLPLDLVTRTLAVIGIRGAGKTVAATVLAEEMCEAGLPWVAIDPVGIWWGLRVNPDGSPGGYPILILGGERGDLPLEKHMGAQIAEAILQENFSCIIDLSGESKNTWRHFVTAFSNRLMELRPAIQRHIFIEEAPELVPQRPMGEARRTLAAVETLVRLGRNQGYGATLVGQRFATIHKDVLTQCENIVALRSIGKHDRDAVRDWIGEVVGQSQSGTKAETFLDSLTGLPDGVGWFWSPQWLKEFCQIRVRQRKTYHPGETRSVGQAPKQVALSDVREFVGRFREILKQAQAAEASKVAKPLRDSTARELGHFPSSLEDLSRLKAAEEENARLRAQLADLARQHAAARLALDAIRKNFEPEYRAMQKLFSDLELAGSAGASLPDTSIWDLWKQKLGIGPAKIITVLCERGELTRIQLRTLCGFSRRTFQDYLARLNTNGLIEKDGDKIRLRSI